MSQTDIQWTDESLNPIRARHKETGELGWHCEKVGKGCEYCYAEPINLNRFGTGLPFTRSSRDLVEIFLDEKMLQVPLKRRKPTKFFISSTTDICASFVPDEVLDRIFAVMALADKHTFQLLTKRPDRLWEYINDVDFPYPNVHLGFSGSTQNDFDKNLGYLLDTPAALRFVSYEPGLEAVDFEKIVPPSLAQRHPYGSVMEYDVLRGHMKGPDDVGLPKLGWVIIGGESGADARPFDIRWARDCVAQCKDAGVPVFVKQLGTNPVDNGTPIKLKDRKGGEPAEWPADLRVREFPEMTGKYSINDQKIFH